MKIELGASVIICKNFQKMNTFYQEVLLQEVEMDFGNCIAYKSKISLWELNEDYPITQKLGYTFSEKGNQNFEFSFETEDYKDIIQHLNKHKVRFLHQSEEEVWGQRTVRLFDPENNLIEIGESIPCFIKRFYNEGMSCKEVATRTSVPLEYVESICL